MTPHLIYQSILGSPLEEAMHQPTPLSWDASGAIRIRGSFNQLWEALAFTDPAEGSVLERDQDHGTLH